MEVFKDYAYYYNAFYKEKDYKEEAAQVDILLKKYGKNIQSILNFGSGTGRHDIELTKLGYQCNGVDVSPIMVDLGRKNAKRERLDIDFSVEDIRIFRAKVKYDAVISLFHVMSYQNKNQDVLNAFNSARNALNKGGVFLFDVWYGPGVLSDKPTVRVKEIEDENYKLVRIAKPTMYDKEDVVDVCYEVYVFEKDTGKARVIREVHSMRYFFKPELEFMLEKAGFELINNIDSRTFEETDYTSWTSYFIARAV